MKLEIGPNLKETIEVIMLCLFNPYTVVIGGGVLINLIVWLVILTH